VRGLGIGFRGRMGGELGPVQREMDLSHAVISSWVNKEHNADGTHADVTMTSLLNPGQTDFGGPWFIPNANVVTPAQLTANTDNFQPTDIDIAIVLRLSTDASRNLTGIYNGETDRNRWLLIINVGNFDLVLKHNVTSTSAYRFANPGGADVTLNTGDSVKVFYDASSTSWRVIGV
jgi:hypothetical protein